MPLFHSIRDAAMIQRFNKELIIDIIDTEVAIYKLSLHDTKTNVYDESDTKVYSHPIKISALINRQPQIFEGTETGQDYTQPCDFGFIRETLKDINIYIEVGDLIEYNGEWWEVDGILENQYWGGKNPDYSFATERWGYNVSIIANTHLTRRSRVNVEEIRSATRTDENNLPNNI